MTPVPLPEVVRRWRTAGWLRPLDTALAAFLLELDPRAPRSLIVAAALLAQLEGRGHACLPLAALAEDPVGLLEWPAAAESELRAERWPGAEVARDWSSSPRLVEVEPSGEGGTTPLVLQRGRLYLRRYWHCETSVAALTRARVGIAAPAAAGIDAGLNVGEGPIPAASVRARMAQLFGTTGETAAADVDWQQVACVLALRSRMTIVTGGPGTGKTWTAARMLVLMQALHGGPSPLRVALAAPTGKAAARLRQSIDAAMQSLRDVGELASFAVTPGPARTLHSLLGSRPGTRRFRHGLSQPLDLDLLVIDEASMVHLEMMAAVLAALPPTARLVLLGDRDQLASVEAGAVMGDLCARADGDDGGYAPDTVRWVRECCGQQLPVAGSGVGGALREQTVALRRSRRFDGPIGELAAAVNRGAAGAALERLRDAGSPAVHLLVCADPGGVQALAVDGRAGAAAGYVDYVQRLRQRPADAAAFDGWAAGVLEAFDRVRVLCALREGPWGASGLNAAIERALAARGLPSARSGWYEGRPVMVTRNDPALGVFNGDVGVVLRSPGMPGAAGTLRAYFGDASSLHSVSVTRLAAVETAFAMTVHKSQGSEFGHVVLVLPEDDAPVLTRELVYTGITRARSALTLACSAPGRLADAIARRTHRHSGLLDRLS